MATEKFHILIAEDIASDAELAKREVLKVFPTALFRVVAQEGEFIKALEVFKPEIVISDFSMPAFDGLQAIALVKQLSPETPLIILTGSMNEDTAVDCLKAGAIDYVIKEHIKRLGPALLNAYEYKQQLVEKNKLLRQLVESEERFRNLAENAEDIIYRYDFFPKPGFTYVSPAATRVTGYTPEEHYTDPQLGIKLIHPDDRYLLENLHEMGTNFQKPLEIRWVKKDGSIVWTEQRNKAICDANGKLVALEGIARDITQRKTDQETIYSSQKLLKEITDNSNALIYATDKEGRFRLVNSQLEKLFGVESELLVGKTRAAILPDSIAQIHRNNDLEVIHQRKPISVIEENMQPDGMHFYHTVKFPLFDAVGKLTGVAGISTDVTKEEKAKQLIKNSEELLNYFFTQSLDGFFFMMLDEPVDWENAEDKEELLDYVFIHQRITKINKAMLEQYGASEEAFLGRCPNDFFAHDIAYGRQVWKDFFNQGHLHIDTNEKKFDGTDMIIEGDYICLYDENRHITGHFGIQRDVTDARNAEKSLSTQYAILKGIIESTDDLIFSVDTKYRYTSFNNNHFVLMKAIYGVEICIGKSIFDFMTVADDAVKAKLNINRALAGESFVDEAFSGDEAFNRLYFEVKHSPIRDSNGQIIGVSVKSEEVTGRKRVEMELEESRKELQEYFENDISANYMVSADGRIISCNKTFIELFGFADKQEAEQTNITSIYKVAADRLVLLNKIRENGSVVNYEVSFVTKKNTSINAIINAIGIFDDKHTLLNVRGYIVDISERKLAENELLKFKLCIQRSSEAVFMTDREGKIIFVNEGFENVYGYGLQESLGKTPRILKSGLYPEAMYNDFWKTLLAKEVVGGEVVNKTKAGKLITVETNNFSILDLSQNIIGFVGIHRDITQRKATETNLKLFRTLIDGTNDAIEVVDPASGQFLDVNERGLIDLGYTRDEFINLTVFDIDPMVSTDIFHKIVGELRAKENLIWEGIHERKDKSQFPVEVNLKLVKLDKEYLVTVVRDITQRKRDEEALKYSEQRHRDIFTYAPVGIYQSTPDGDFITVNQQLVKILGYRDVDELMLRNLRDDIYFDPQERNSLIKQFEPRGHIHNLELKWLKKDGTPVWVGLSSHAIKDENNQTLFFEGFVQDITERKRANDELLKLSRAVEQSPASIIITDTFGYIEYVNPKCQQISGYSSEDLIGVNPRIFSSGEQPKEFYTKLWNTITQGKEWVGEFHNRNKNGSLYWELALISPIINEQGETSHYLAVKEDITESKRTAQIQKVLYNISKAAISSDSLRHFVRLIQSELMPIIDTTNFYLAFYNEADETISLPFFEDEFDQFTTFPAANTITHYVIRTSESLLADWSTIKMLEQKGEIGRFGTDSLIWLGVPLKIDGKVIGVLALQSYSNPLAYTEADKIMLEFIADQISILIYRRKVNDDLLQALARAEESDRLKSAFLANMSHEIRTPMNGILGFAELLKVPGLTGAEQQKYIGMIEKSGDRMLNIINDIVNISRIESGLMDVYYDKTNVNEQLEFIYQFFKPEGERKGLEVLLTDQLPADQAIIETDKEKLYAVLTNLVKNAIKFTATGFIRLGCVQKQDMLEFYVKDSGFGIPDDQVDIIFERFRQGSELLTRNYEGAGLGLAISKAYVEMMGGNIWVESKLGKGSAFWFTIPVSTKSD
ncbi:MAG: PAS domain S-box protein [Bacteroidales bacterium]|nr:PAS domain S-box protein [Bacteroidales bacterium]